MLGLAFVAAVQAPASGQPGHRPLHDPAVAAQPLRGFDAFTGDAMTDAPLAEPSARALSTAFPGARWAPHRTRRRPRAVRGRGPVEIHTAFAKPGHPRSPRLVQSQTHRTVCPGPHSSRGAWAPGAARAGHRAGLQHRHQLQTHTRPRPAVNAVPYESPTQQGSSRTSASPSAPPSSAASTRPWRRSARAGGLTPPTDPLCGCSPNSVASPQRRLSPGQPSRDGWPSATSANRAATARWDATAGSSTATAPPPDRADAQGGPRGHPRRPRQAPERPRGEAGVRGRTRCPALPRPA